MKDLKSTALATVVLALIMGAAFLCAYLECADCRTRQCPAKHEAVVVYGKCVCVTDPK